jgi:hypothetical protein
MSSTLLRFYPQGTEGVKVSDDLVTKKAIGPELKVPIEYYREH